MAKVQNLVIGTKYEKNGEEKMSWATIGVLITGDDGKQFAKLHHIPGQIINVYDQKPRDRKSVV